MNEAETRAELIDPKLAEKGWGVVPQSKVLREYEVTEGKIQIGGKRGPKLIADYILVYKGLKLATIEAKSLNVSVAEGVAQAKHYAQKLSLDTTFATNGSEIYQICMRTGKEALVDHFPTPEELWDHTFAEQNQWREKFAGIPFEDKSGTWQPRFYQEIAINKALEAIANNQKRILLTLATGTGKTAIAFQIAWKLFQTRWNLMRDGSRRPRILFLADRNILADQAFNAFSAFDEDALIRIKPSEIKKKGRIPTNGSVFFTIFQSFMSGTDENGQPAPYFGDYPADFFDLIIVDECHRGGANDESNWRGILEYFSPAVQLGLTATPKRKDNVDTYKYFGNPVYVYSLKEGVNDGFLTPYRVKRIQSTLDEYIYTSDDQVIIGEVEEKRIYKEADFNKIIEIKEREAKRVQIFMDKINQNEKAIVFCANQDHAAAIRDLVNQYKKSTHPQYCVRVTANDGALGEMYLRDFQDNEKSIPTILTTSQKLSTGVDARNIRSIVLMRPINSMIEFKQIVGRGTRLFEGKEYFTIYDFVEAYKNFLDPDWDGEPEECSICKISPCICESESPTPCKKCNQEPCACEKEPSKLCEACGNKPCTCERKTKIKIKLGDGKIREFNQMTTTMLYSADGKPMTIKEFCEAFFGDYQKFFKNEKDLCEQWSKPMTRKVLLDKLAEAGYGKDVLQDLQKMIDAENSDLFDVLEYIAFSINPIPRQSRVASAQNKIFALLDAYQKEFLEFVLSKYIESGVEELDQDKLPTLLTLKYHAISDAIQTLGTSEKIRQIFIDFQKYLYDKDAA